jgi:RNA polymerase sigma-70 factor, ECF subfamily
VRVVAGRGVPIPDAATLGLVTVPAVRWIDERDDLAVAPGAAVDFGRMIEPYLAPLHAHCYRMLASRHDADDALQDALLRAWRGFGGFDLGRPLRPWLYKITTNACLDTIAKRPSGESSSPPGPTPAGAAPTWLEPYPDHADTLGDGHPSTEARYEQRETVELAFVVALQHIPHRQRAVLILRDVLGFSARETAAAFDTTTASVNSTLQRARQTVERQLPGPTQLTILRSLGEERLREIAQRFMDAFESGDVTTIMALLTEDVAFSMPADGTLSHGQDAVSRSWLMPEGPPNSLRYVQTQANGQLAFGVYRIDQASGSYLPLALDVVSLRGTLVAAVAAFCEPDSFAHFGLPTVVLP